MLIEKIIIINLNLTEAQKKVVREIRKDVLSGFKMNRLIYVKSKASVLYFLWLNI